MTVKMQPHDRYPETVACQSCGKQAHPYFNAGKKARIYYICLDCNRLSCWHPAHGVLQGHLKKVLARNIQEQDYAYRGYVWPFRDNQ